MAIDVSAYVSAETTSTGSPGTLIDDLLQLSIDSTPPEGTPATEAQMLPFAEILADAIGRALQHVKDNAVAKDGTSGGGDDLDID